MAWKSHWAPKMQKWCLIEDITAWIREQSGAGEEGLRDGSRISLRDLNAICRAIDDAKSKTTK